MQSVIVADPHALMREGLVLILRERLGANLQPHHAASYPELLALAEARAIDVILVEPALPGAPGPQLFRDLRQRQPAAILLAVVANASADCIQALLSQGAQGVVPKGDGVDHLIAALLLARNGGCYIPRTASPPRRGDGRATLLQPPVEQGSRVNLLTRRQRDVLDGIRRGLSNRDIAAELAMSEGTVKNHVKALMRTLQVRNRTQAALVMLDTGSRQRQEPAGSSRNR